jgi:hypothetical protein
MERTLEEAAALEAKRLEMWHELNDMRMKMKDADPHTRIAACLLVAAKLIVYKNFIFDNNL